MTFSKLLKFFKDQAPSHVPHADTEAAILCTSIAAQRSAKHVAHVVIEIKLQLVLMKFLGLFVAETILYSLLFYSNSISKI